MNKDKHWLLVSVTLLLLIIVLVSFQVISANYRTGPDSGFLPTNSPSASLKQSEPPNSSFLYGVNVEMSQLLPTSNKYVVNDEGEDLIDIAAKLGINIFRITNGTPAFTNDLNYTFTKPQWDLVLDKMHNVGIQALILIESPTIYQKIIPPEYPDFVQSYLLDNDVLSHPAVFGVDLYNEPLITEDNVSMMRTAAMMIKAGYSQTRLTIGWWAIATNTYDEDNQEIYKWDAYSEGRVFEDFIDFYSLHLYGFDTKSGIFHSFPDPAKFTRNFVAKVRQELQTEKPMLIEEFGAANGAAISDQDTIGSSELQANTYAGVYQALSDMKDPQLIGAVSYQFYQRSETVDAWAIVKNKGNYFFTAAYVLQKYAKGMSDIPLSLPLKDVPNDFLLTNKDNRKTLRLKVNDIVGIKMSLDQGSAYTVTLADESLFLTNQPLLYDATEDKFQAVFQALHPGNQDLTIWECLDENCTDRQDVFTVSFTIK